MKSLSKKKLISLIIFILLGSLFYLFFINDNQTKNKEQTISLPELSIYHNKEYGFEFQYPNNWEIKENIFYSPASKFNLNVVPIEGKYLQDPVLLNIVSTSFADSVISKLEELKGNKINVTVDGILGIKYEYISEGLGEIAIVLSFNEYDILIGAKKRYEDIFNQIFSTLKFLK